MTVPTGTSGPRPRRPLAAGRRLPLAGLLIGAWIALTVLLYLTFTTRLPSANDFYPRWVGARASLQAGASPYAPDVTRQTQIGMFGRPAEPNEDQVAFAYPLYVVFLIAPLAYLPYPWAQATWQALLVFMIGGTIWIGLDRSRRFARPAVVAALILAAIVFYPTARALLLGQFAVVVVGALALALWAQSRGRDGLAGAALALGLIKPQLILLIAPAWLVWAARRRRWPVIAGFLAVAAPLIAASLLLQPTWPVDFWSGLREYQAYTRAEYGTQPTLRIALAWLPAALADPLYWLLGLAGVGAAAVVWWRLPDRPAGRPRGAWAPLYRAYAVAAIATLVFPFDQPTTNQLILLPVLALALERARRGPALVALAIAIVVPWVVFLATQRDRIESPLQYLVVLVPAAAVAWWATRRPAPDPPVAGR